VTKTLSLLLHFVRPDYVKDVWSETHVADPVMDCRLRLDICCDAMDLIETCLKALPDIAHGVGFPRLDFDGDSPSVLLYHEVNGLAMTDGIFGLDPYPKSLNCSATFCFR